MSWLAGLAPITGPRWSCGAYWADAASPDPSDTDWGDSSTWAAAHVYDPDAALSLGVFVAGEDATDIIRSVSFGLGHDGALPRSVQPSSCSATFRDGGQADVGDRLVILTEWTILWSGRVESTDYSRAAGMTSYGEDIAQLDVQAVDELERTSHVVLTDDLLGGDVVSMAQTLMARAGVVGTTSGDPERSTVIIAERNGTVLGVLSQLVLNSISAGAWTPEGLRLNTLELTYLPAVLCIEDLLELDSLTRTRSIDRVINEATVSDTVTPGETVYDWPESQAAYGLRPWALDVTDWALYTTVDNTWYNILNAWHGSTPSEPTHTEPIEYITATAKINTTRHQLTQLLPFDQLSDGDPADGGTTDRWRITRTLHRITPDSWTMDLSGHAIGPDAS